MLSNISLHLRVRWRSSTNTQGLPRYRLPIMPSQNVSLHVPSCHSSTLWEMTYDARSREVFAAFVGIDWADAKHDGCLQTADPAKREDFQLEHTPEAIDAWVTTLRTRRPCLTAACRWRPPRTPGPARGRRGSLAPRIACLRRFTCPWWAASAARRARPCLAARSCHAALAGEDPRPAATPPERGHRLRGPYASSSSSDACPSSSRVSR